MHPAQLQLFKLCVSKMFDALFGPADLPIPVVIFLEKFGKLRVRNLELMNLIGILRELVMQMMVFNFHGGSFAASQSTPSHTPCNVLITAFLTGAD